VGQFECGSRFSDRLFHIRDRQRGRLFRAQGVAACLDAQLAESWTMPALTRRRDVEAHDECWHVYYGDIHAGTIAKRIGIPPGEDPWGWACGFYPGSHPGEHTSGSAPTFERARADFEEAWKVFLSHRTEADFQAWRDQQAWTTRKYALWDAGKRLPPNEWEPAKPCSAFMKCPCGEIFNSHQLEENLIHVPHISAVEARRSYIRGGQSICE
jgi:hypothetical protein